MIIIIFLCNIIANNLLGLKDNIIHFHLDIRFLKIIYWLMRNFSVTINWEEAGNKGFWVCGSAFGRWMPSLKLHKTTETLWKRENQEWRGGLTHGNGPCLNTNTGLVYGVPSVTLSHLKPVSPISEIIEDQRCEPFFRSRCPVHGWVRMQYYWLQNLCFCHVLQFMVLARSSIRVLLTCASQDPQKPSVTLVVE